VRNIFNRKDAKILFSQRHTATEDFPFYVIPQGSLQLSAQLWQANAKILSG
jgi:hypothetical protein